MPINPMMRGSVGRSVPSPLSKVISVERGIKNKRRKKIILKYFALIVEIDAKPMTKVVKKTRIVQHGNYDFNHFNGPARLSTFRAI